MADTRNPWGTMGAPTGTIGDYGNWTDPTEQYQPGWNDIYNNPAGGQSLRLGDTQHAWNPFWQSQVDQQKTYDPAAGWIIPYDLAKQAGYGSYNGSSSRDRLGQRIVQLVPAIASMGSSLLGSGVAAGAEGGMGAIEAGAAAANADLAAGGAGVVGGGYGSAGTLGEVAAGSAEATQLASDIPPPQSYGDPGKYGMPGTGLAGYNATQLASGATAGSALSRIFANDGTATTADWVSVLGTAGATGLGMFSSQQQANSLERLANQNYDQRRPYLAASQGYLADPESYWKGPGQQSLQANLRALSVKGNPADNPTLMGEASYAGLKDWRDAVTGFGNMGLSGADTRATLGVAQAGAQGNVYSNLAGGISSLINPPNTLADLMRQYKYSLV